MLLEINSMTTTIISSIVLFLGISLLLVVILLIAKKYLVPSGKAVITINDDKKIEVETGGKYSSPRPVAEADPVRNAAVRYWKAAVRYCPPSKCISPANNK